VRRVHRVRADRHGLSLQEQPEHLGRGGNLAVDCELAVALVFPGHLHRAELWLYLELMRDDAPLLVRHRMQEPVYRELVLGGLHGFRDALLDRLGWRRWRLRRGSRLLGSQRYPDPGVRGVPARGDRPQ
jgi:hypothetical protein